MDHHLPPEHTHIRSIPLIEDHPLLDVVRAGVRSIAQRARYLEADLDWASITIEETDGHHGRGVEVTVPIKKREH